MGGAFSERKQVAAILLIAGTALGLLWFFLLLPLNRQRHKLETEIAGLSGELAQKNLLLGEDVLQLRLDEQVRRQQALRAEWTNALQAITAIPAQEEPSTASVAHIDFKVKLFDVRLALHRKSRELDVNLPRDLGVDETIESDDDAYQRMMQLLIVQKLVDLALDLKIKTIREIRSLPRVLHQTAQQRPFFYEYPLELVLSGTLDNLYEFLNLVSDPGRVFVLRTLRAEPPSDRGRSSLLTIKVVMSGLVFAENPEDLTPVPVPKPAGPRRAMGY